MIEYLINKSSNSFICDSDSNYVLHFDYQIDFLNIFKILSHIKIKIKSKKKNGKISLYIEFES
jgi:hypothetical protein